MRVMRHHRDGPAARGISLRATVEQLQAAYEDDPQSVDPEWQEFFAALKDDAIDVRKNARGASWSTR